MKIKLIIFALLFSFCSNEIVEKELIINNELFQDALELESKRNIEVNAEEYMIINYWASWCLECIEEHEILIQLANTKGLEDKVFLLSFQDSEENAKEFISKYGKGNIQLLKKFIASESPLRRAKPSFPRVRFSPSKATNTSSG